MFIFNSNAAKYTFEYKLSKPYRVTYSEKLLILPSIMRSSLEQASGEMLMVDYALGGISAELRDLLINYTPPESDIDLVDYTIGGFSVELKDVLITHESDLDKVDYVIGNISGVIENA